MRRGSSPRCGARWADGLAKITRMRRDRFREQLERTISSAAVPYGYTLSIWGGGGVAIHALGPPTVVDALLYVAGGAIGFFASEVAAHGDLRPRLRPPEPPPEMAGWGAVQLLPAGVSVLALLQPPTSSAARARGRLPVSSSP